MIVANTGVKKKEIKNEEEKKRKVQYVFNPIRKVILNFMSASIMPISDGLSRICFLNRR